MMLTVGLILAAVVLGAAGIAWDFYKPSRFRTSYRNVASRHSADGSSDGLSSRSGSDGLSSGDGGSDCGGGD